MRHDCCGGETSLWTEQFPVEFSESQPSTSSSARRARDHLSDALVGDDALRRAVMNLGEVLSERGVHAALAFLNGRTRHRFTGLYRFDPPMLRSISLFDRENPTLGLGGDVLMRETYCSLVGSTAAAFATADAASDERLGQHPARESTLSYCGVPLLDGQGQCYGTLCHFDLRPRLIPQAEIPLLELAAPLFMRVLARGTDSQAQG